MAETLAGQVSFRLLLDPEQTLRRQLDIGELGISRWISPLSIANYAKAWRGVRNFDLQWSEARNTPGMAVFTADQKLSWLYLGEGLGDYPSIDAVLEQVSVAAQEN